MWAWHRRTCRMKTSAAVAVILGVAAVLLTRSVASAGEVKVLSAVGMRQVMLELGPAFERASGHRLSMTFDSGGVIVKRIEAGESVDVVIIPRAALERLTQAAKISTASTADLASSVAAVAVRQGAPKPDISSAGTFKRALVNAKSIAWPDPAMGGSSGLHITSVIERLGIADAVKAKSVRS